jgi:hypothetical protein
MMEPFILAAGAGHDDLVPVEVRKQCINAAAERNNKAKK